MALSRIFKNLLQKFISYLLTFFRKKPEKQDIIAIGEKNKEIETAKPIKSLGWSGGILLAPHTTEKSTAAAKRNQYMFRVSPDANKIMIARAVEKKYGVNVVRVNTMNVRGKRVRIGKREGRSPGFKKAMVTIQEGQTIDVQ